MFIPLMLLAVESSSVIAMRTMKLMAGDGAAMYEARLIAGASGDQIINRYRQHVAVNAKRLGNR
jgi:hypothetical protein